jgi:MFS family permease
MKRSGLWANDDFLKLWIGETISIFGSLIGRTALIFTAVLVLDATPLEVGLLAAADIVPGLAFGFLAGVWVDRFPRRPIMIAADVGRAALLASVPLAYAFDALTIEQLLVVAVGMGSLTIFADVAYFAYVPSLLSKEELLEGNSKVAATNAAAEVGAFSAAGWLVQVLSGPVAVAVDAASFIVSSVFTLAIRKPEARKERPAEPPKLRDEMTEGMRVIAGHGVLRTLTASHVTAAYSLGAYGAVYLLFVTRDLGFEPGLLGLFFAVGGISSFFGSLYAPRAERSVGAGPTIAIGRLVLGACMMLAPVSGHASVAAACILIGQQLGDGFWAALEVNEMTLRQTVTPEDVLGRVNAAVRQANLAAMLLGALSGGLLGELVGLRATLITGACGMLVAGGICVLPAVWTARALPSAETAVPDVVPAPAEP